MWLAQFRAEVAERDRRSDLAAAQSKAWESGIKEGIAEGMEKGLAKGMEKGIEKGSLKKALDLAQKFMALGHSRKEAAEFAEIDIKLLQ